MDGHWQLDEAKQRFSELITSAETDGPQFVTRHGEEIAVVVSIAEYRHIRAITLGSAGCGCIWYRRTGQYRMTALQWPARYSTAGFPSARCLPTRPWPISVMILRRSKVWRMTRAISSVGCPRR
jgi:prevent-host-death family protein